MLFLGTSPSPARPRVLKWFLIPSDEAALRSLTASGDGPFRTDAPVILAAARGTVAAEILLPPLLFIPCLRSSVAVALGALLLMIQLVTHEMTFGLLMACLLSTYVAPRRQRFTAIALTSASFLLLVTRLLFPQFIRIN